MYICFAEIQKKFSIKHLKCDVIYVKKNHVLSNTFKLAMYSKSTISESNYFKRFMYVLYSRRQCKFQKIKLKFYKQKSGYFCSEHPSGKKTHPNNQYSIS